METKRIREILKRTIHSRGKNVLDKGGVLIHRQIKHAVCDTQYPERISSLLEQIPESNGSKYYVPYEVSVAIVADEFLYRSFQGTADFRYVTPDNYKEICEETQLLLIVSAWRGLHQEWRWMGTQGTPANTAVHEMISYYHKKGRAVIFYSKEDPPHYDHFLPIARRCDVIFTSAAEKIASYMQDCQTKRVYLLEFGIHPVCHNPIGCRAAKRQNEVIFSGSWMKKYPERVREQRMIFDGVLASGRKLKIIDRNYEQNNHAFLFPAKYYKYISPSIGHRELQKVHKLYDWAVNVNSVTDSKSMFANRVYELQANGNLLLSNDSVGISRKFAGVKIVHAKQDVCEWLNAYSEEELYLQQIAGVRCVMTGETTFDRVGSMLSAIGFAVSQPVRTVAVLVEDMSEQLKQDFENQTYADKRLIEWNADTAPLDFVDTCDMIAFWSKDSRYGKFYLEDMIDAFKYTNSCYITKNSYFENGTLREGVEHNYTSVIHNVFATVFWKDAVDYWEIRRRMRQEKSVYAAHGYSADHFHYRRITKMEPLKDY